MSLLTMPMFIVCFQRPQGEARTYALGADDALKFAASIEEGIVVESVKTGDLRANYRHWKPKHRVLVSHWLDQHASSGWFAETSDVAIFERSDDALAFRIWVTSDPFGVDALRYRPTPAEQAMTFFGAD